RNAALGGAGVDRRTVNLIAKLEEYRAQEQKLAWEGTFADYLDLVVKNPRLADLSHARIHRMIQAAGAAGSDGARSYKFFAEDLFGVERPLQQLVEYFSSAGRRLEVRKRILLLMGPVGGGKSTIVALLKRGLERHARTAEGAVYAIKGCPM